MIKITHCLLYLSKIVKRIPVICIFVLSIANNEAKRNITTSVEVSHKSCEKLKTKATENRVKEELSEEIISQKIN